MTAATLFDIIDGGASASPFVVIRMACKPRGKGRHRTRIIFPKNGKPFSHEYPDPATADFEKELAWIGKAAMRGRPVLTGPLAVRYFMMMPVPKSWSKRDRETALSGGIHPTTVPDGDNIEKVIGDALNEIVWQDDKQIVRGMWIKEYAESPGLIVEVFQL